MVAVSFLTATLKKCFFIMLWLKIKNNFILCVRSVTIFDKIRGLVSTFDIKLIYLIHMRKAWGVRREVLFLTLYSLRFTLYDFLLKLLLFWRTYLSFRKASENFGECPVRKTQQCWTGCWKSHFFLSSVQGLTRAKYYPQACLKQTGLFLRNNKPKPFMA